MYSHEDRLRAVQLYIKLGKRIGLTIRQLGYPTKDALKTCYREYEQSHELRAGYTRPAEFSQAQKQRAVEHYLEHGRCIAATIKALGYPCRSLLSAWLQALYPQRARHRSIARAGACAMGLWRKTAMPRQTVFYFASQLRPTPQETAINYGGWVPGLSAPPTRFPYFDALVIYSLDLAQPVLTQPKVCPPIPQKC